jgi:hypothetical protein
VKWLGFPIIKKGKRNMECMCAYWGSPKAKVNFQNKEKKNI